MQVAVETYGLLSIEQYIRFMPIVIYYFGLLTKPLTGLYRDDVFKKTCCTSRSYKFTFK